MKHTSFRLDDKYLTSISIRKEYSTVIGKDNLTEDDTIKVLKGEDKIVSISSEDHPEFANLRNELEELGFIKTQRNCWNGDEVLKSFKFNGKLFKINQTFPCSAAMPGRLKYGV